MRERPFAKYEGLGNDFVVLDAAAWSEAALTPALARALCDRHRGVGGDGVLWVARVHEGDGRAVRLVIYNADGSRPEMCGNGVRCVIAWLAHEGTVLEGETVVVHTDAGPRPATLVALHEDTARVAVEMGLARVDPPAALGNLSQSVIAVDVGNPHGVVFGAADEATAVVDAVRAMPRFPQGVNVELAVETARGFRVRVNERGVGWTQACGTGACAVVAAAVTSGRVPAGIDHTVTLDGGDLAVRVTEAPGGLAVRMTGPATRVFRGGW